ncbi:hydroxyacylglutathione hydrolase [Limnobacter parvus]|uniref:Hydroxyacylglutathione hydrolase n=1 Tax=Limnobacter parvus TaxID=2939690 RepID=A0ABT1XGZ2_9BURK|nr:hydroxyacylglutathione hydrolase [Limnobacter parvus]MCR2746550.1 hydroxyacylglutathione hydrolase [Limnobacter parvus]
MESFKSSQVSNWSVYGIPAFQDNYLWAIVHEPSKACIVVDPGCARSVQAFLNARGYHLSGILVTHHHPDHVGGIDQLLESAENNVPVYGPATGRVPQVNRPVREGDTVDVHCLVAKVLEVPGHTLDHIAYVIELKETMKSDEVWMFPGDTLFSSGCGRLFEGTALQMYESLQKLNQFPDNTLVFCAHEYTESNIRFARFYESDSKNIKEREVEVSKVRQQGLSTIPTTLGVERSSNLFLNAKNPIEFKQIRDAKDRF